VASVVRFLVLIKKCTSGKRIAFLPTTAQDARIGERMVVKRAPILPPAVAKVAAQEVPRNQPVPHNRHRTATTGKRTVFPSATVRDVRISDNEREHENLLRERLSKRDGF